MNNELIKRVLSTIILIPLVFLFIIKGSFIFNFFLILIFLITIYEWYKMNVKKYYNLLGFIFLILSFYSTYKLRIYPDGTYVMMLLVTIICVSTDIGGYIFGKIFKGPKLTKYSPNKTYSGMIGAFITSFFLSIFYMKTFLTSDISIGWIIFVIIISAISQLGDIIISYFKRLSNIKDTGKIIPGHGGLLDRIDGMIFAFPVSYLILSNIFI